MLGKSKPSNAKTVLVLGAGYVASPLVEMLTRDENVHVIVASELQGRGETGSEFFVEPFLIFFFTHFSPWRRGR